MAISESNRQIATVRLDPRKTSVNLVPKIERLKALYGKRVPELIQNANQEGLQWIQRQAEHNLEEKIRLNKRPDARSRRLEKAIFSDEYSAADGRGIRFLIDKKIRTAVPYYASLEYGDDSQIGRRIPFYFFGTDHNPLSRNRRGASIEEFAHPHATAANRNNVVPGGVPRGHKTDRLIGPREAKTLALAGVERHTALIQRPVPQYRYGRDAGAQFLRERIYEQILDRRIVSSGLDAEGVKFVLTGR